MKSNATTALILAAFALGLSLPAAAADKAGQKPRQSKPSEIMPLADKVIVNDLEDTGKHLVAVGERGDLFLSAKGQEWRQIKMPTRAMLTRVVFYNADIGWAVGWDGVIVRTTDGGEHWTLVNFEPDWGKTYFDVLPTGPDSAIVVGSNGRYLTTDDAGKHFKRVKNDAFAAGFNLYDIARVGQNKLVIAGERGFLGRSLDNGKTWQMLKPPYRGSYFGVRPLGDNSALFFGLQGRVFVANDISKLPVLDKPLDYSPFEYENVTDPAKLAAMGWRLIDNPVEESIYGGALYGNGEFLGVGVDGTMVIGSIAGGKLHQIKSPTAEPISDVLVRPDGLILSGRGGFYHRKLPK